MKADGGDAWARAKPPILLPSPVSLLHAIKCEPCLNPCVYVRVLSKRVIECGESHVAMRYAATPLHDTQRHNFVTRHAYIDLCDMVVQEYGEPAQRPRRGVVIAPSSAQRIVRAAHRTRRSRRRLDPAPGAHIHRWPCPALASALALLSHLSFVSAERGLIRRDLEATIHMRAGRPEAQLVAIAPLATALRTAVRR